MKSLKKITLFLALVGSACTICGLVIGWGLLYLYQLPFVMTTFTIIGSDTLWAILLGPILLAACYGYFSKKGLLYTDIMKLTPKPSWSKTRTRAIAVFVVSAALCFVIPAFFEVNALVLLPIVELSFFSIIAASV